jgi:hypothetical protein
MMCVTAAMLSTYAYYQGGVWHLGLLSFIGFLPYYINQRIKEGEVY